MGLVLRAFAFVFFSIAAFVALAIAHSWEAALLPGGLALWVLAEILAGPLPRRRVGL